MAKTNKTLAPTEFQLKDAEIVKRYTSETGKILPRRYTRLTHKQQRYVSRLIKRMRNMLLLK